VAAEASRTISEDRRNGGLELLLSTPLHESEIVGGQLAALWRQFMGPVAAVVVASLVFTVVEIRRWGDADERASLLGLHLVFAGFLVADMIALSWDGMWLGLNHRKPNRATLLALTRIVVLPTLVFFALISLWASTQRNNDLPASSTFFALWILIGLSADLYIGLRARAKLEAGFRIIVSEGRARQRPAQPSAKPAPVLMEAS